MEITRVPKESTGDHRGRRFPMIVGTLAVVVVIAVLGLSLIGALRGTDGADESRADAEVVAAAPGSIVPGFPMELLPAEAVRLRESYSVAYEDARVQSVVRYASGEPLADNVLAFRDVLIEGGWRMVNDANPSSPAPFFYATRDGAEVNVTFIPNAAEIDVTVSYVERTAPASS